MDSLARRRPLLRVLELLAGILFIPLTPTSVIAAERATTPLPAPLAVDPATQPAPPPTKASGPTFEERVAELVNQERWANGQLPPLKRVDLLDSSSETHSSNMAVRNFFAHCDLDTKTSPFDRILAAGYAYSLAGENIAAGQTTPASVMSTWMASSGHRANILHTGFRELGVGYFAQAADAANIRRDLNGDCTADSFGHGPFVHYWTQNFGTRSSVFPVVIEREAHSTSTPAVDLYLYGAGWASEMRLRNDGGAWTPWLPFTTHYPWILGAGNGTHVVDVELRNASGTVRRASDSILLTGSLTQPSLIFADGFESGDTSAWSATVGGMTVAAAALPECTRSAHEGCLQPFPDVPQPPVPEAILSEASRH